MKYICNFSGINPLCNKGCHHNDEHDREMIPFESDMDHCTTEGYCNIADRDVCCEPIGSEVSDEM